jgi:hypothetical protein
VSLSTYQSNSLNSDLQKFLESVAEVVKDNVKYYLKKPLPQLFSRISIGGRITKHLQMRVNPWDKYLQIQLSIALLVLQIVSGKFI